MAAINVRDMERKHKKEAAAQVLVSVLRQRLNWARRRLKLFTSLAMKLRRKAAARMVRAEEFVF